MVQGIRVATPFELEDSTLGLLGGNKTYADAIAAVESAGLGDYAAIGPKTKRGDRAYGRYQVMGANLPAWTRKYVGRELTPEQFLADHEVQDAVFEGEFGSYVKRYGNPQDAASAWFTGKPLVQGANRQDILGTTGNEYVDKFNANLPRAPQRGSFGDYFNPISSANAAESNKLNGAINAPQARASAAEDVLGMVDRYVPGVGRQIRAAQQIYSGLSGGPNPFTEPANDLKRRFAKLEGPERWASYPGAIAMLMGVRLPEMLMNAITAPRRAFTGELQVTQINPDTGKEEPTPQAIGEALNFTSAIAGTAFPFAQKGAVGIFGGRLSRTARHQDANVAQRMTAEGAEPEKIWQETGWFKSPIDAQWRSEINDSSAQMFPHAQDIAATATGGVETKLGRLFDHPELYAAYPELRNVKLRLDDSVRPGRASMSVKANDILMSRKELMENPEGFTKSLLHELQHFVQFKENFAKGTNAKMALGHLRNDLLRRKELAPEHAEMLDGAIASINKAEKEGDLATAYDAYKRAGGEVESRNVERRRAFDPQTRQLNPPWATQDVPFENQFSPDFNTAPSRVASKQAPNVPLFSVGVPVPFGNYTLIPVEGDPFVQREKSP